MNQMVFVLYRGTIPFKAESYLKLTKLSAIISLYLAKFIKHYKSNTTFLYNTVIIFSPFYLSEANYATGSFNLWTNL